MTHFAPLNPLPAPRPVCGGVLEVAAHNQNAAVGELHLAAAPEVGGAVRALRIVHDRRRHGGEGVGGRVPDVGVAAVVLRLDGILRLGDEQHLAGRQHDRVDRRGGDLDERAPQAVRLRRLLRLQRARLAGGRQGGGARRRVRAEGRAGRRGAARPDVRLRRRDRRRGRGTVRLVVVEAGALDLVEERLRRALRRGAVGGERGDAQRRRRSRTPPPSPRRSAGG